MKQEIEMPEEVEMYLAIMASTGGLMGLEAYNRCKEIEGKYPDWFPWEAKYKSISNSVHEAYREEAGFNWNTEPIECKGGLMEAINNKEPIAMEYPKDLSKAFEELFEADNKRRIEENKAFQKRKAIWDKHYSVYGLEFRD